MRGAIWGDPYTIRGETGDDPPSEPLESVFSQQRDTTNTKVFGGDLADHTWPGLYRVAAENRGFTDLRCLAPQGGPRWHPPLLGGGRFTSKFTSKFAGNLEYSGIDCHVN